MRARRRELAKLRCLDRQHVALGPVQRAEAVERGERGQRRRTRHLAGMDAVGQHQYPPQHVDIETRQRQRRPGRARGDVEQHQPAIAAMLGRHQRRAVGKPRPGAVGEIDRRLGQHLARHRHVGRNAQAAEWTGIRKAREVLRLGPGERAAEIASADAQLHRQEVVDVARHVLPPDADEHAAVADEFRHRIGIGDLADVRQHQHRDVLVQQALDIALVDVAVRTQRALEVEGIR